MSRRSVVTTLWLVTLTLSGLGIWLAAAGAELTPQSVVAPGYGSVGAFVLIRRSHRLAWLFLGFGLLAAATGAFFQACDVDTWSIGSSEICNESRLGAALWPANYAFFGLLLLLFPDGRLPSRRWSWVALLFVVSWSLLIIGSAVAGEGWIEQHLGFLIPLSVYALLACASAPFFRARGSNPTVRRQLRYLGYVVALALALLLFIVLPADLAGIHWLFDIGVLTLFALAVIGVPLAIGAAILRYRLYDIDLIVNRTLVYALLSAALLGSYLALVVGLQALADPLTTDSDLAVAASTLAVAALFRPMRSRVQSAVDRRFFRSKYDARAALAAFTARLRDEVDLSVVGEDVILVVRETVQPAHVALWLKPGPTS